MTDTTESLFENAVPVEEYDGDEEVDPTGPIDLDSERYELLDYEDEPFDAEAVEQLRTRHQ